MNDGNAPPSAGGPRFRIVAGRGIGERSTGSSHSPAPITPSQAPIGNNVHLNQNLVQHQQLQMPGQMALQPSSIHQVQPQPTHIHQLPQQSGMPAQAMPVTPNSAQPAQPAEDLVAKCVRFFKTLITLSQQDQQGNNPGQHSRHTASIVKELVATVIFGTMPAEEFTGRLQEALKSQAQPHLLPFLQKTLPYLRNAIRNGDVVIEGISPPSGFHGQLTQQPPSSNISHNNIPLNQQNINSQQQPPNSTYGSHLPPRIQGQTPVQIHHQMAPVKIEPQLISQIKMEPSFPQKVEPMDADEQQHPEEDVIQVRALQESPLRAALLRPEDIMKKITHRMNEACYVEEEVLTLISDAAECRLRSILEELATLAEHRVDPLRLNPNYGPLDDTRRQLRYLEDLDRQQEEQRENREKEQLIRMSKSKGIAKDTIDRAKEMQRADAEAKRNRDANAAAIAALSGNKTARPKWDQIGGASANNVVRPRTIRVTLKDLHALVNHDPACSRSQIVHKLALSGGPHAESL